MDSRLLFRIALPVLGLGVIVAAVLYGVSESAAVGVGGLCAVLYLVALGRSVGVFVARGKQARPLQLALGYVLRLAVSAAVLIGLIQVLPPVPLAIGFGTVLLTTMVFVGRGGLLVPNPTEGA